MSLDAFLKQLRTQPETVSFSDTMSVIDAAYDYTPTAFTNGEAHNAAGQNAGSCKLLAFGLLNELTKEETLSCFGTYYREDVLKNPEGSDHQNIRNFMKSGWEGVAFEQMPLRSKQSAQGQA